MISSRAIPSEENPSFWATRRLEWFPTAILIRIRCSPSSSNPRKQERPGRLGGHAVAGEVASHPVPDLTAPLRPGGVPDSRPARQPARLVLQAHREVEGPSPPPRAARIS